MGSQFKELIALGGLDRAVDEVGRELFALDHDAANGGSGDRVRFEIVCTGETEV